jgi:hypothetical protein
MNGQNLQFSAKELFVIITLFIGTIGLLSLEWYHDLKWGGGISSVGAERVQAGEIPYRDFWTMYAPGHFYLLAMLFQICGTHLMVERIAASVIFAATACSCYWVVRNLSGARWVALVCAGIFVAATLNTGYCKSLGSYPPAVFFILIAYTLMIFYYKTEKLKYLIAAGLATGTVTVFKHDVGGYTAIAIIAGLVAKHFFVPSIKVDAWHSLLLRLVAYSAGVMVIVLPILVYFAILAGPDMWQDLIIFPLTDFRYARPEGYPSLLPFGLYDPRPVRMLYNLATYLNFAIPFGLFLLGIVATGWAVVRRQPMYITFGVTFVIAFLLHHLAAHVQINTHLITISMYSSWLGGIFYKRVEPRLSSGRPLFVKLLPLALSVGWFLSLLAQPLYMDWGRYHQETATLRLAKVSRFQATPERARTLDELSAFVEAHLPPGQKLFVGLHRHDIVVIGDALIYFILNRPMATRYQELHPAIVDTAQVQQEIIADLREQNVSMILLKHIFSDEVLDVVKTKHLKNLPYIGATDLDEFIRENYMKTRKFGPYEVWVRIALTPGERLPHTLQ